MDYDWMEELSNRMEIYNEKRLFAVKSLITIIVVIFTVLISSFILSHNGVWCAPPFLSAAMVIYSILQNRYSLRRLRMYNALLALEDL